MSARPQERSLAAPDAARLEDLALPLGPGPNWIKPAAVPLVGPTSWIGIPPNYPQNADGQFGLCKGSRLDGFGSSP